MIMVDRMDMVGIGSFFSKAKISLRTASERYLVFKAWITPWSIGWVCDVCSGVEISIQSNQDFLSIAKTNFAMLPPEHLLWIFMFTKQLGLFQLEKCGVIKSSNIMDCR